MMRIVRRDGVVAFYVWDYPGGGIEFMRAFWTAAVELDPEVRDLTENSRFPFCTLRVSSHSLVRPDCATQSA
jgi:hypothetical protein